MKTDKMFKLLTLLKKVGKINFLFLQKKVFTSFMNIYTSKSFSSASSTVNHRDDSI